MNRASCWSGSAGCWPSAAGRRPSAPPGTSPSTSAAGHATTAKMVIIDDLRALTAPQQAAFVASLAGWALDAFDYFLLVFVLKDIAHDFHADIANVNLALFLTLAARPV